MGVRFKRLIMDDTGAMPKSRAPRPPQEPEKKRVVMCSGKIFYELHAQREAQGKQEDIALVRIEQVGHAHGWVAVSWVRMVTVELHNWLLTAADMMLVVSASMLHDLASEVALRVCHVEHSNHLNAPVS